MTDQDYWAYSYALCASGRQKDADELIRNLDKETSDALYWQYRIYKKRGNIDKALDFIEKSNLSDNEIIRESLSQSLALAQRNYYESQYELSEYKAKNRSKTIVIIITLSLLLILLVLWVASRHIKSQREEKERYLQYADEITRQLEKAKKEYKTLRDIITHDSSNDIEDTSPTFKIMEEGAMTLSKEEAGALAQRQYKFIQNLEAALIRIENKTYGVCRMTGKLIPKERLRLVPHATLTVEAKEMMNKNR